MISGQFMHCFKFILKIYIHNLSIKYGSVTSREKSCMEQAPAKSYPMTP